jgi:hypothetical protein
MIVQLTDAQRQPIRDDQGNYDHRGRKWPICQCPCVACLAAWACLLSAPPAERDFVSPADKVLP